MRNKWRLLCHSIKREWQSSQTGVSHRWATHRNNKRWYGFLCSLLRWISVSGRLLGIPTSCCMQGWETCGTTYPYVYLYCDKYGFWIRKSHSILLQAWNHGKLYQRKQKRLWFCCCKQFFKDCKCKPSPDSCTGIQHI